MLIIVILIGFISLVSHKPECPPPQIAEKVRGELVTILDIRKDEECENQTLLEAGDRYRLVRCGYFGKVGEQFYFVDN